MIFRRTRLFLLGVLVTVGCAAVFGFAGCASEQTAQQQSELMSAPPANQDQSHNAIIERNSAGEANYSGFYNTFEYKATLLNSEVRASSVKRQADYYKWDEAKTKSEREKSFQEMASETSIFVSFFTPDRHNDNLSDAKPIWRILLEVGGQRYTGKAKKLRTLLAELQSLYPYHTRWNTPYLVTFPVPTTAIENQKATLTITGPLGSKTVEFKPIK